MTSQSPFRLFRVQDLWFIIAEAVSTASIVASSIHFNLIAFLISLGVFLCFAAIWLLFIFLPWYRLTRSVQYSYKGIKFCYERPLTDQEVIQCRLVVNNIEEKLENKLSLSKVCVIDKAFDDLIVFFVNSIDEKYFNARYGTSYKKIYGLTSGKVIQVDIDTIPIPKSALGHEIGHAIMDQCSSIKDDVGQESILSQIGV